MLLYRYLYKNLLPAFLMALGILTFILAMNEFLRFFNLVISKGVPLLWILRCFSLMMPFFLSLSLPMSFLVGLLLGLGGLTQSGEILALRSSGFSFQEILKPFFWIGAGLCALMFLINHKIAPSSVHAFQKSKGEILAQVSNFQIESGKFIGFGEFKLFAKEANPHKKTLKGVLLYHDAESSAWRIHAKEGRYELKRAQGIQLTLKDGVIQLLHSDDPKRLTLGRFESYQIFVPIALPADSNASLSTQELTSMQIYNRLRNAQVPVQDVSDYRIELALRSVTACAPLIFFLLACPIALKLEQRSKQTGLVMSLAILFGYYGCMMLGMSLGKKSPTLAWWAPWTPNFLGAIAGFFLWRKNLKT